MPITEPKDVTKEIELDIPTLSFVAKRMRNMFIELSVISSALDVSDAEVLRLLEME